MATVLLKLFIIIHLQCVKWFFDQGCPLVILACNTASAKALRTIQQNDLPTIDPDKRVLGVIRPTTEIIGNFSETKECRNTGNQRNSSFRILPDGDRKIFSGCKSIPGSLSYVGAAG